MVNKRLSKSQKIIRVHQTSQTDRRTDGRATYHNLTAPYRSSRGKTPTTITSVYLLFLFS